MPLTILHYLCQYISETTLDNMNSGRPINETIITVSSNTARRLLTINLAHIRRVSQKVTW